MDRRDRMVEVAMRHFAEAGYRGTRVEDIAHEVGVAKGTVFGAFGSKEGLFLAAYERAVSALPSWLDAPERGQGRGILGDPGLVARPHRGVRLGRSRPEPRRADRALRHGPGHAPPDRSLHAQRGPLRHARVRGIRP